MTDGRHSVQFWSVAPAASRMVFQLDEPTRLGDVWTLPLDGGQTVRVTGVYDTLDPTFDLPVAQGQRVRPRLLIDVFNVGSPRKPVLYDQQHYLTPDRTGVNSNYGAVTGYQPPMSARVGMVVDF